MRLHLTTMLPTFNCDAVSVIANSTNIMKCPIYSNSVASTASMHRQMIDSDQRMRSKPMSNVFCWRSFSLIHQKICRVQSNDIWFLVSPILQLIYLYGLFIFSLLLWALFVTTFMQKEWTFCAIRKFVNCAGCTICQFRCYKSCCWRECVCFCIELIYKLFVLHKWWKYMRVLSLMMLVGLPLFAQRRIPNMKWQGMRWWIHSYEKANWFLSESFLLQSWHHWKKASLCYELSVQYGTSE